MKSYSRSWATFGGTYGSSYIVDVVGHASGCGIYFKNNAYLELGLNETTNNSTTSPLSLWPYVSFDGGIIDLNVNVPTGNTSHGGHCDFLSCADTYGNDGVAFSASCWFNVATSGTVPTNDAEPFLTINLGAGFHGTPNFAFVGYNWTKEKNLGTVYQLQNY
jgi:hypothetical protein